MRNVSPLLTAILALISMGAFAADPGGLEFTQSAGGPGVTGLANEFYIAGQNARMNIALAAESGSNPVVTFVDVEVPDGWRFAGVGGASVPEVVPLGTTGKLSFGWLRGVPLPASFYVELAVPADETKARIVNTSVRYADASGVGLTSHTELTRLSKDTVAPVITLLGAGLTLDCEGVFIDPGFTAFDNAEGDVTANVVRTGSVDTFTPGRYTLTYTVTDRSGNSSAEFLRRVVVLDNCPGNQTGPCADNCATDNGTDTDGDGLTDCQETCIYGTNVVRVDTDGDGMSDEYESRFLPDLDPRDPTDRDEDADGDGFTNFEEFLRGGSPLNANEPDRVYFVSNSGFNGADRGTRAKPLRTIAYAINQAAAGATAARPASVVLLPGVYREDVQLRRFVTLAGEAGALVQGAIAGAFDSGLRGLIVSGATPDDLLLDMTVDGGGFNMRVTNVVFRDAAIGARLAGDSGASVFEGCRFANLEIGMEVEGALPKVRRCIFQDLSASEGVAAGVLIRSLPAGAKQASGDEGSLGDITDAGEGWNRFDIQTIDGASVINERTTEVKMEENDWGVDDEAAIGASIQGPADFTPFLAAGASLFASTLVCTVWDAADQARIEDATVAITPGTYTPQTENIDGVYTFAAVADGLYTVTVNAPGFDQVTQVVTVPASEIASVIVPLGEATGGCNLFGNKNLPPANNPGDMAVAMLAIAGMIASSIVWRMRG
ncbi:MAG: DUF5011 domain-containing protein [Candidatus Hydrogenedens sp.]|nr:DUF5011 domain-containing protein [Candidatus Hydrogenedens sp.]